MDKIIEIKDVNDYIVAWLKDYATKSKVKGFVIGISSGIDSAVTSTLCAQTGLPVLCIEMPIHQDITQVTRGKNHIEFLKSKYKNVSSTIVDLTIPFDSISLAFANGMPNGGLVEAINFSLGNARARLRMTTLYFYAGMNNMLVAGTGNKVEDFGVGFFTKYGDGGVDLSPIGDLMKSEVRQLAKYQELLPEIVTAIPTDGLFADSRTDEDQLGATYEELERAMNFVNDNPEYSIEDLKLLSKREVEVLTIYKGRHNANKHKMVSIPVCTVGQFRRENGL